MTNNKALLIIDTQVNMFDDAFHVHDTDHILNVISALIAKARVNTARIVYIRNNGAAGEPDEPGSSGWEIHADITPGNDDIIIDKTGADAFENTNLQDTLNDLGVTRLIIVGMQSEMCVTVTCKRAAKLNYDVLLVEDGHTTFNWEEISATETIAQANQELSAYVKLGRAEEIDFK